jgi:hypothetical protein
VKGINWDRLTQMGLVLGDDHRDSLIDVLESGDDAPTKSGRSLVELYAEDQLQILST